VRVHRVSVIVATAALLLAACTDKTNLDLREGLVQHVKQPLPGVDQPFPNLSSVPDTPPPIPSKAARNDLVKALQADNTSATYNPDFSKAPKLPAEPQELPSDFLTSQSPVKVPETPGPQISPSAQSAPAQSAALLAEAPAFGATGHPDRIAIVLFAAGSAEIDPAQVAKLKPVVAMLHRQGGGLQLVGYATHEGGGSGVQDKIADFHLSLERANRVGHALAGLGVKPDELVVSAEGGGAPVISVAGVSGGDADERVDIYYWH